jgi:hypothetical protein
MKGDVVWGVPIPSSNPTSCTPLFIKPYILHPSPSNLYILHPFLHQPPTSCTPLHQTSTSCTPHQPLIQPLHPAPLTIIKPHTNHSSNPYILHPSPSSNHTPLTLLFPVTDREERRRSGQPLLWYTVLHTTPLHTHISLITTINS